MIRGVLIISICLSFFCPELTAQDVQHSGNLSHIDEKLDVNSLVEVELDEDKILKELYSKSGEVQLPYLSTEKTFVVDEFSIYGEAKNPFPEIKTYRIFDPTDPGLTGRITSGPAGINIIYLKGGRMVRIYTPKMSLDKTRRYVQEVGINDIDKQLHNCTVHEGFDINPEPKMPLDPALESENILKRNGSTKRVYRTALMCTGEYFTANGGGAIAIRQLMTSNLNDISAIFEKEIAVELIVAQPLRLQDDIDNDPFDPSFGGRTQQAQDAISTVFADPFYDIGHVFHNHTNGDGWATGGVAGLGVVCNDNRKASGWSGSFNNTSNGWISLAAHEFGHMFNATHTFNGSGEDNCTNNIAPVSNYEIGSGTTIMSYNGLCAPEQNIPSGGVADNYFHVNSLDRMINFMEDFGTCNTDDWIADNNNEPEADANPCGAVYTIPRNTPFFLKGAGTDMDGDMITYCWEQYDEDGPGSIETIGLIGNDAASKSNSPLFRSYPPTPEPIRYIPRLSDLANNVNSDFEVLPSRTRNITFRLTVRDNNEAGGGVDWDEIQINATIDGPHSVITPAPNTVVQAGSPLSVTWNTGGSEEFCEKAIIRLSTDGGLSFPIVIADDIDYAAGEATIDLPASFSNTNEARVMVACDDYECFAFFDMTNGDFTIQSDCFAPSNTICDTRAVEFDFGDSGLDLSLQAVQGTNFNSLTGPMPDFGTLGTMAPTVNNASGTCTRVTQNGNPLINPFLERRFSVTSSGTYVFTIDNSTNDLVSAYTIFEADGFSTGNACSSFVESNASFVNGSYSYSINFSVELDACKEYILAAQVINASSQNLALSNITGPGSLLLAQDDSDYDITFIAVDVNSDIIVQQDPDSDFRTLPVGEYYIASAFYKSGGIAPPDDVDPDNWIGQSVGELLSTSDCFRTSIETKPVKVNPTCFVFDIVAENQTSCNPQTNTYDQTISFKVDMGPGTGTVTINGQDFILDGDESTVTLRDLVANGRPVDLEFQFSEDSTCDKVFEDVFVSAPNCCPIDIDLGEDILLCEGESLQLDAGAEAVAYAWFKDGVELPESGQFLDVTIAGEYLAQVTHDSGCINEDMVNVDFESLPEINLDRSEILACEGDLIILNSTISINNPEIQWLRNNNPIQNSGSSIQITESGEYEIIATTSNGCSNSATIMADFADSPEVDLGPDILTCLGSVIFIDAGDEGEEYSWRRNGFAFPDDDSRIAVSSFGTYSVVVTNANGCIGLDTVDASFEQLPILDFGRDVTRCFGNFFTIEANPSEFEIEWYLDGELIPGENDIEYTTMASGEYVGLISHNDQCEVSDTVLVDYLDSPDVNFPEVISACPGETVQIISDDLDAVYSWSSESSGVLMETSNILEVTESDIYYVQARSISTFCITRDTVEVNFTDIPVIDLGPDLQACDGEIITIGSPTEGFPVEWYLNGERIDNQSDESLDASLPGEYVMRIDSGADCETTDTIQLSFSPSPEVNLGDNISACPGETIILEAGDNANSYTWFLDGNEVQGQDNRLSLTSGGTVTVEAVNSGNCTTRDTVEINFSELPVLEFENTVTNCEDDVYSIETGAEGFSVEWYFNGELISGYDEPDYDAQVSGEYVAFISGGMNCSVSDTISVNYETYPVLDLGPDRSACPGDNILLVVDDMGYGYEWRGENQGVLNTTDNTLNITETDTYYVKVSTDAGCSTSDTVSISFVELPELDLGIDTELCAGETYILENESNGFDVEWYLDGSLVSGAVGNQLEANATGQYIMRVSASQDCRVEDTVNLVFNDLPVLDLGEDRSACPGDIITLDAGNPDNTFEWSSELGGDLAESDNTLEVSESDTYFVNVSSTFGCESRDTVTITFTELPMIELGEDVDTLCEGETFDLEISAQGFDIEWRQEGLAIPGANEESYTVSSEGEFSVVVSAGDNCSVQDDISISYNPLPEVNMIEDAVACSGETLELNAGTDGRYNYSWSDENDLIKEGDEGFLIVDVSGTYSVSAMDNNGCVSTESAEVTFISAPEVELPEALEFCEGASDTIVANANVSVVEWYFDGVVVENQNMTQLEVDAGGEYIAVVGPGTQCEDRDTITVNTIDSPEISILSDNLICSDQLPYTIEVDTDQNTSFRWFAAGQELTGETGNTLEISQGGSFLVEAENNLSCSSSAEVSIQVFELATIDLPSVPELCEGDAFIMIAESDGVNFEWRKDGALIPSETDLNLEIFEPGTYEFVSYNEIGCPNTESFTVDYNPVPEADFNINQIAACTGDVESISVPDQPGNMYSWFRDGEVITGENSNSLMVSESGNYSVEVINEFGCSADNMLEAVFNMPPTLDIADQFAFCEGGSVEITIQTNASDIEWSRSGEVIAQNTTIYIAQSGGDYSITAASSEGCNVSEDFTVIENENPEISLDDVSLCPGESATVSIPSGFENYNWSGYADFAGSTQSSFEINYDGFDEFLTEGMSVMVTDDNGCQSEADATVSFFPLLNAETISDRINLCEGESEQLGISGGLYYDWNDPDGTLSATDISDPIATPQSTTTYTVSVTDDCPNNFETFDIEVIVNPLPEISAGSDTCTIVNADLELRATGGVQYIWNNNDLIVGSSTRSNVIVNLETDTTFTVTGVDENGCEASDSVRVCILEDPFEILTAVTLITPNGDFSNDVLEFRGLEAFPENKLTIFNRWGNVIYTKSGYQNDAQRWDGTRDGEALPADTYYYILEFSEFTIKKSITLLRD